MLAEVYVFYELEGLLAVIHVDAYVVHVDIIVYFTQSSIQFKQLGDSLSIWPANISFGLVVLRSVALDLLGSIRFSGFRYCFNCIFIWVPLQNPGFHLFQLLSNQLLHLLYLLFT